MFYYYNASRITPSHINRRNISLDDRCIPAYIDRACAIYIIPIQRFPNLLSLHHSAAYNHPDLAILDFSLFSSSTLSRPNQIYTQPKPSPLRSPSNSPTLSLSTVSRRRGPISNSLSVCSMICGLQGGVDFFGIFSTRARGSHFSFSDGSSGQYAVSARTRARASGFPFPYSFSRECALKLLFLIFCCLLALDFGLLLRLPSAPFFAGSASMRHYRASFWIPFFPSCCEVEVCPVLGPKAIFYSIPNANPVPIDSLCLRLVPSPSIAVASHCISSSSRRAAGLRRERVAFASVPAVTVSEQPLRVIQTCSCLCFAPTKSITCPLHVWDSVPMLCPGT